MSKSELNPTKNDHVMRFLVSKDFSYRSSHAGGCRARGLSTCTSSSRTKNFFFKYVPIEPTLKSLAQVFGDM